MSKITILLLIAGCFLLTLTAGAAPMKKCVHIASYEDTFEWTSKIDATLKKEMKGQCEVTSFFMDTKRNPSEDFAKKKGLEAKELIDKSQPDLVFLSDDNAVKWVLLPFYKDVKTPFVFVGVNWTVEPYKLPFKNTTGVIEVAPIDAMIYEVKKALPGKVHSVAYLAADNETQRKEFPFIAKRFQAEGFKVVEYWAKTQQEWLKGYDEAQSQDFVYVSNQAGIKDFNTATVAEYVKTHQKKLSAAINDWQIPYVGFVMAKSAAEQGELGAEDAKQIFLGKDPHSVPITANKLYGALSNPELLGKVGISLSEGFQRRLKMNELNKH